MTNQVSLVLFFLLLVLAGEPVTAGTPVHTLYLPAVSSTGRDCTRRGLAWTPGDDGRIRRDLATFCAGSWYGMAAPIPGVAYADNGRLPILPCNDAYSYQVARALGPDYDGDALLFNEPDRLDQCNLSPYAAAVAYVEIRHLLPAARLIAPNAIDATWLAAWIGAVEALTGAGPDVVYGIHVYGTAGPTARIDAACAVIGDGCRLWVTEWGQCNPAVFADWLWQLENDGRVERHFTYTTDTGGYANRCYSLYRDWQTGELADTGRILAGQWNRP